MAPLTQEVRLAVITGGWPNFRDTLGHHAWESHRRATCSGYTLTPEEAQRVERVERIAADVDAGRRAREAGRDALSVCYLRFDGVCPSRALRGRVFQPVPGGQEPADPARGAGQRRGAGRQTPDPAPGAAAARERLGWHRVNGAQLFGSEGGRR